MLRNEFIEERIKLKNFLLLFFPVALMTFSINLFPALEKILLASLSPQDMEASLSAFYATQLFQMACVSLVMMAQVFVGGWYGEKNWIKIGPGVWQFIWFSLFSFIITVPLGILYGKFYFKGTPIQDIVLPYYYFLLAISFLFPLGAALTSFFLGQGKTWLIFITTISFHLIKLPIGYALIFGWKWIPGWGLMGGAYSIFITQLGFCLTLLFVFLNKKNHELFRTKDLRFNPSLFWECIHPGLLRALNRILTMGSWGAITYLMATKGEDYLLILSIGGTLFLFIAFFAEALCTVQMTVVSQLIGSRKYDLLYAAFKPGLLLNFFAVLLLSINLIIYPDWTFQTLFPNIVLDPFIVRSILMGVWLSAGFCILSFLPISYILAFKDTYFSLLMGFANWITGFLFIYVFLIKLNFAPQYFWMLMSFVHFTTALFYLLRTRWLINKLRPAPLLSFSNTAK